MTNDYKECVTETIFNCIIYRKVSDNNYTCNKCKEKYYLEDGKCIVGEI